ncbi:sialate O-acetylesterase [Coraliomargarita sp. SDUM461004]|uniref:Sialate O-acetylesterase n=1 Tax=Thalassobacterium sedimentorum TaxID=3041258 RepID=A0ABU1AGH2_9BACT|nr:sialate O-acetylesterase [Coraliomargarita sp. SDUM461004]MDQ8193684.1 sialate O-acetylesterase [Coraliomargarita sp. SDUM461004]
MNSYKLKSLLIYAIAIISIITNLSAEIKLPSIFTDHMVLQRGQNIPVWGTSDAGASLTIQFADQIQTTTADSEGKWRIDLAPLSASATPRKLSIISPNQDKPLEFHDILVGDVWLCAGQSNMQWTMQRSSESDTDIANAQSTTIRLYNTPRVASPQPRNTVNAQWTTCTPESVRDFSAVAYYFGQQLNQELEVPIGLLLSAWGGTRIEPWTPPIGFKGIEALADIHAKVQKTLPQTPDYKQTMGQYLKQLKQWTTTSYEILSGNGYISAPPAFPSELILGESHQEPTKIYNGMIHAHIPFAIKGAIWYQGESNHEDGLLYVDKTRALLKGWRSLWGYDFPFYFVQIAPFNYNEAPERLAEFWEAQSKIVQEIPNTGMAVINDVTDLTNIHPANKKVPGKRLARLALANTYNKDLVSTGPVFKKLEILNNTLKVHFDSAVGLSTRDGKAPDWFEITDRTGDFKQAQAIIEGTTIVLKSNEVAEPLALRFAWHKLAIPNLINGVGLPASPFRAGKLPEVNLDTLPAANGFRTVYQIQLPSDANYAQSNPDYDIDNTASAGTFNKVAYFLELQKPGQTRKYVFVSMDTFSKDPTKIGIPTAKSGARFMQKVSNLTVRSNVEELSNCDSTDGGNIEFWPGNYRPANEQKIVGASHSQFDYGDRADNHIPGYGSMQIHNWKNKETVLAINHWGANGILDIGIGNSTGKNSDWTFSKNAKDYSLRRLTVLVK